MSDVEPPSKVLTEEERSEQERSQHLADISLRTTATILAILFAYTFAVGITASQAFKLFMLVVGLILLGSITSSIICLVFISNLRTTKRLARASIVFMIAGIVLMFCLLALALFGSAIA